MNEASYIIKKHEEEFINQWNQTRYIVYSIIQSQSTKLLTPTDILKFPWEEKEVENLPVKSKRDLIQYAKEMEKILNKNNK